MNLPKLNEILARVEAASVGPWEANGKYIQNDTDEYVSEFVDREEDAELIANAPTDLALLAECLQLAVESLEQIQRPSNAPIEIFNKDVRQVVTEARETLTKIKSKLGSEHE